MFRARPRRPSPPRRRGAALVEAAVVLPLFLMVILGIVEFGRAMMVGQLVTNAAREGARRAILFGSNEAEVRTHVADFLSNAGGIPADSVGMTVDVTDGPRHDGPPATGLADAQGGDRVTVTVSVPWGEASWGVMRFLSAGESFDGIATMRHE